VSNRNPLRWAAWRQVWASGNNPTPPAALRLLAAAAAAAAPPCCCCCGKAAPAAAAAPVAAGVGNVAATAPAAAAAMEEAPAAARAPVLGSRGPPGAEAVPLAAPRAAAADAAAPDPASGGAGVLLCLLCLFLGTGTSSSDIALKMGPALQKGGWHATCQVVYRRCMMCSVIACTHQGRHELPVSEAVCMEAGPLHACHHYVQPMHANCQQRAGLADHITHVLRVCGAQLSCKPWSLLPVLHTGSRACMLNPNHTTCTLSKEHVLCTNSTQHPPYCRLLYSRGTVTPWSTRAAGSCLTSQPNRPWVACVAYASSHTSRRCRCAPSRALNHHWGT
jgi:hypothetical protein